MIKGKIKFKFSLFPKLFIPYALIIGALVYYFFFGYYLPSYRQQLRKSVVEKGKITAVNFLLPVKKAIQSGDDLGVMQYLKKVVEDADFSYARVIDSSGTVVAHNNISEWGKVYKGKLLVSIISQKKPAVFYREKPSGYDCSLPFTVSEGRALFLSVGISDYKLKTDYGEKYRQVRLLAIYIFAGSLALGMVLIIFIIIRPLKKLKANIESLSMGKAGEKIPVTGSDEISSLETSINSVMEKISKDIKTRRNELELIKKEIMIFVKNVVSAAGKPYFILDRSNKIIDASEEIPSFIGSDRRDLIGHSVIDLPEAQFFTDLVREASQQPNKFISKENTKAGVKLKAVSFILSSGEVLVTLILF